MLVDPLDPAAIAAGIEEALGRRDELRAKGLERAQAFTWDRVARDTWAVYEGGRVSKLVVIDADVLGRHRTGDETYVQNLLRRLPALAGDEFRFAAITRRPDLVPEGVEAVELPARFQELRMAWRVPRALRRLRPALAHFQHALPPRCPCPAVVTVHDLSFERTRPRWAAATARSSSVVVPRSVAPRAPRVIAVSERTKRDLVDLYGVPAGADHGHAARHRPGVRAR